MAAVTEDVKPTNFTGVFAGSMTSSDDATAADIPDLATLEETKKTVQKVVHEHESFWSWFCFRVCCCDGYCPVAYFDCGACSGSGGDCCVGCCTEGCCEGCCTGDCCANCAEACCVCPADAEICTACCACCAAC